MRALILSLALLFALPAFAQDDEAARRAAAERYIKSDSQQSMLDQIMSPEVLGAQMKAQFPQIPADKFDQLIAIAVEEVSKMRPTMEQATIDAAVATFTTAEITALDEFYRSKEGSSVLGKLQPFMQRSFASMGPAMQSAQKAIAVRVQDLMKN